MRNVAILTTEFDPFRGGVGAYARELAAAAVSLNLGVSVFAPDYGAPRQDSDQRDYAFAVRRFRAGPFGPGNYGAYARVVARLRGGAAFDQVHAADLAFGELCAAFCLHRKTALTLGLHGSDIRRAKRSARGRLFSLADPFAKPARITTNSAFTRDLLLATFPAVAPSKVRVAHLGVRAFWFDGNDRPRQTAGRFTIACAGRLTPRKGQLDLLRAVASLSETERSQMHIQFVGRSAPGDDAYRRALREAALRAAPATVSFLESADDAQMRQCFLDADLFCLPGSARHDDVEGFGLVFAEAAACGLPSVAGAVGGVPEVVIDGVTGALTPPDDPAALARAILLMRQNGDQRAAMGAAARDHARRFSWRECARLTFGDA